MITVERLGVGEADDLRDVRLEALTRHPEAYSADLSEAAALTPEQWADSLANTAWFGVRSGKDLVAIAAFIRPQSRKVGHTGELAALYVRPTARGTGVADALVRAVIAHAAGEVEQIKVGVTAGNTRAAGLYERHGFRTVGRLPNAIRIGDRSYDEVTMVRPVSLSD